MKLKSKVVKVSLVLFVLGGLAIISVFWHRGSPDGKGSSGMGIFLAKPAFAQESGVSFLEQEAGISAYTNVGRSIDLTKAKSAFRTVERETGEYVIGSVPLPGYSETEDVHAYVHKDGWIVIYYLKNEPAAKIVDWNNYGADEKIKGTKLETGIVIICTTASVSIKDMKYYDFRNPDANRLMIVAEAIWNDKGGSSKEETFKIKLPNDFIFYERSFSHYSGYEGGSYYYTEMYIDENKISSLNIVRTNYGLLSPTLLSLDIFHTVKIYKSYRGLPGFGAIVLLYRGT